LRGLEGEGSGVGFVGGGGWTELFAGSVGGVRDGGRDGFRDWFGHFGGLKRSWVGWVCREQSGVVQYARMAQSEVEAAELDAVWCSMVVRRPIAGWTDCCAAIVRCNSGYLALRDENLFEGERITDGF
jgi:hypothetical protein